jgi:tetratricopeptide (TPR) repeat protein
MYNNIEEDAKIWIDKGFDLIKLGLVQQAIEAFKQAISINPNDAEAYRHLGVCYNRLRRCNEAIIAFRQAISINPNDAETYTHLGSAYGLLGLYQESIDVFKQAIIINPNNANARRGLDIGTNALRKSQQSSSQSSSTATSISPIQTNHSEDGTEIQMLVEQGIQSAFLGHQKEAIEAFEQAINVSISLDDAESYTYLGAAYKSLGRYEEAIEAYKQAITIQADNATAYFNLGTTYIQIGRNQEAIDALIQAISIKPNDAMPHYILGGTYALLGRNQEAIEAFEQSIRINPSDDVTSGGTYEELGNTYGRLERYQEAIEAYRQAININPDNIEVYIKLGVAYGSLNRYQEAVEAYKQAININPNDADARIGLDSANSKLRSSQQSTSQSSSTATTSRPTQSSSSSNQLSKPNVPEQSQSNLGQRTAEEMKYITDHLWKLFAVCNAWRADQAVILKQGISLDMEEKCQDVILFNKGCDLVLSGEYQDALICFNEAIKIDKEYEMAYFAQALTLTFLQRYKEALECFNMMGSVFNDSSLLDDVGADRLIDIIKKQVPSYHSSFSNSQQKSNYQKSTTSTDFGFNYNTQSYNNSSSSSNSSGKSSSDSSSCFIATEVYGNISAPEVLLLRKWRDIWLNQSHVGRKFIEFYYQNSPNFVLWLKDKVWIKKTIKLLLDVFIRSILKKYKI